MAQDRKSGVVVVGDELLNGKRTDKHLPHAIEVLQARQTAAEACPCLT